MSIRCTPSRERSAEVPPDLLTGVLNRMGRDQWLAALVRQRAGDARSLSLLMIDIDHFRKLAHTIGHVIDDQVIRGLAELLCRTVPEGARMADAGRKQVGAMQIRDRRIPQVLTQVSISGARR